MWSGRRRNRRNRRHEAESMEWKHEVIIVYLADYELHSELATDSFEHAHREQRT